MDLYRNGGPLYLFFHMYVNEPFWTRLKVRIILYFAHANEERKANCPTYKIIY